MDLSNRNMKTMKIWRNILVMTAAILSLVSCSSDPQWADEEAHEKTEQLQKQYGPMMIGTWYYENISDTERFFEQLTFNADGTLSGMRKWQIRKVVTIEGEQRYTDWESVEPLEGTFSGTWKLSYYSPEGMAGEKRNCLLLNAKYEGANSEYMAYSNIATFDYADETTLRFEGFYFKDEEGRIVFLRGTQEPSF
jgi:ABC-type cobalt transport system substrate-binding protein